MTGSTTPDFPVGFVNFEDDFFFGAPSIEIRIYRWTPDFTTYDAPDSLYVDISFPIQDLQRSATEFFSAFFYDQAGASWRVKFPDSREASTLGVQPDTWNKQWSWGQVDLAEIDFERYVEPALGDWIGPNTWLQVKDSLEAVQTRVASGSTLSCTDLNVAITAFGALKVAFGVNLRVIQDQFNGNGPGECRLCDATTGAFVEELGEFVGLKFLTIVVDMLQDEAENWKAKLATYALAAVLEQAMESLTCDYECLIERAPPEFYVLTGLYWTSELLVQGIQLYKAFTGCPAAPQVSTSLGSSSLAVSACTPPATSMVDMQE